jgi:hypothetical protein
VNATANLGCGSALIMSAGRRSSKDWTSLNDDDVKGSIVIREVL